jgi:predicted RNA-binding Zn ribbon-like protein
MLLIPSIPPIVWRIGGALVLAVGLFAGGYWRGHHIEALTFDAYKAKIQAASAQAIASAEQHAAKVQDVAEQQQAATVADYQEKIDALNRDRDAAHGAATADAQRVFVPVAACGSSAVPAAAAGTNGADGARTTFTAQLQPAVALNLINLAADADYENGRLRAKIAALQKRVNQDLTEINGP